MPFDIPTLLTDRACHSPHLPYCPACTHVGAQQWQPMGVALGPRQSQWAVTTRVTIDDTNVDVRRRGVSPVSVLQSE